jgi:hypothetical protein
MSRLVARILLSMLMFPLAVMVYALTAAVAETALRGSPFRSRDEMMFLAADVVTWAGVATYWCLLWRSSIRWTPVRVGGTLGAAVGGALVGGGIAAVMAYAFMAGGDSASFALFLGGILAMLLWLFATIFLWRETAAERAARVAGSASSAVTCPTCGYNLTGLGDARCPECGSRFTLDELLAAQPARVAAAAVAELE